MHFIILGFCSRKLLKISLFTDCKFLASKEVTTLRIYPISVKMSTENGNDSSLPSDCDVVQDLSQPSKSGFRGKRENIWPHMPSEVKKRVNALKKMHVVLDGIDQKFFDELHTLECKYHKEYVEIYNKRSDITQGYHEPTEEECDFPSDKEDDVKEKMEENKKPTATEEKITNIRGIPDFWLTILKNTKLTRGIIKPHDEPILSQLIDIKTYPLEELKGFVLEFHFAPNEWFANTVLTKEYNMNNFPEVTFVGCTIDWNEGKNVTMRLVHKKQIHRVNGQVRFVKRIYHYASFFRFFSPSDGMGIEGYRDIDIGFSIRDKIIPKAVLYYTGKAQ